MVGVKNLGDKMICWDCKFYSRSKQIMFGLGMSKSECSLGIFKNREPLACGRYRVNKWIKFWDRITRQV